MRGCTGIHESAAALPLPLLLACNLQMEVEKVFNDF
jgi:hypothetical protein